MKEIDEQGICSWKVKQDNIMYDYSGEFKTVTEAWDWFLIHGTWLEEHCNRNLHFVQT